MGDQGNLNYRKGDAFTTYVKGSHELLLKMPDDITFLGRVNWVRDLTPPTPPATPAPPRRSTCPTAWPATRAATCASRPGCWTSG